MSINPKSNKANGKKVFLGNIPELEGVVFKSNSKDQADMYLRNIDSLANYATVKYTKGTELSCLVKYGEEAEFTEPEYPRGEKPGPGKMEQYKSLNTTYRNDTRDY